MENKKKKNPALRIIGIILLILIAAFILCCIIWHRAAYVTFKNVTVKKYDLDETAPDDWKGGKMYLNVPYAEDSDSQYVDIYVPDSGYEGEAPQLFVMIHGGGFVFNDSRSRQAMLMYRYFRDHGYACASINYRLAQEAEYPGAISDCKAAIRFLKAHAEEYGYTAEKVPVWGESAGGYLAVMCGVTGDDVYDEVSFIGKDENPDITSDVDVVVDYYGHIDHRGQDDDFKKLGIPKIIHTLANSWLSGDVTGGYEDVESFWFRKNVSEMTEEEYNETSIHAWIDKTDTMADAFLIIHGDCDITVPYYHSVRLYEHLQEYLPAEDLEYDLIPDMGHASDPLFSDEILSGVDRFLKEKLN